MRKETKRACQEVDSFCCAPSGKGEVDKQVHPLHPSLALTLARACVRACMSLLRFSWIQAYQSAARLETMRSENKRGRERLWRRKKEEEFIFALQESAQRDDEKVFAFQSSQEFLSDLKIYTKIRGSPKTNTFLKSG